MEVKQREKWSNKTEFLLSSLGYAIGIGNVWRFPYLCYRSGGGAFLVPYLIMLFFCGVPLYFMETSLGQFSSSGCLTVFNIAPLLKGVGIAIICVNLIVSSYFVTIYAYPLLFLYHSFQPVLPWSHCENSWNTNKCIKIDESSVNLTNFSSIGMKSSSEEFFNNKILNISESIEVTGNIVVPLFMANTLAWLATYFCMCNGIKSVGKAVYFTATFPFLILFVLLMRGVTLPGAIDGIYFYIYPQWKQLTTFKVWCDAAIQIFYSLGPGWGGIINIASYNNFYNNNKRDSIIVPLCNSGTSIVAGFVVFSVLGFMSHKTGIPVASVAAGGPGLAFVTYPEAISLLPWPNLWATLFFLMLFFLGLSSCFVSTEAIVTSITDEYPKLRRYNQVVVLLICVIMWAFSTIYTTNSGMYWLALFDWYSASIPVIFISIMEVILVGWIYGISNFIDDIHFMIMEEVSWFWRISWKFSTPLILIIMFIVTIAYNTEIYYDGRPYPKWAIDLGWVSCYVSMACLPLYMGYHILYKEDGDIFQRVTAALSPIKDWGPADIDVRLKWLREVKLRQVKLDKKPEFVQLTTTV
ncbi:hypothetical protein ABEB36_012212 [Hypothenemus hampei]|uniref:Transporter n=1 Tax=Hypothenemus hampei TaxID=57062 RepID=A0ABD1EAI2_HYPHA